MVEQTCIAVRLSSVKNMPGNTAAKIMQCSAVQCSLQEHLRSTIDKHLLPLGSEKPLQRTARQTGLDSVPFLQFFFINVSFSALPSWTAWPDACGLQVLSRWASFPEAALTGPVCPADRMSTCIQACMLGQSFMDTMSLQLLLIELASFEPSQTYLGSSSKPFAQLWGLPTVAGRKSRARAVCSETSLYTSTQPLKLCAKVLSHQRERDRNSDQLQSLDLPCSCSRPASVKP